MQDTGKRWHFTDVDYIYYLTMGAGLVICIYGFIVLPSIGVDSPPEAIVANFEQFVSGIFIIIVGACLVFLAAGVVIGSLTRGA